MLWPARSASQQLPPPVSIIELEGPSCLRAFLVVLAFESLDPRLPAQAVLTKTTGESTASGQGTLLESPALQPMPSVVFERRLSLLPLALPGASARKFPHQFARRAFAPAPCFDTERAFQ